MSFYEVSPIHSTVVREWHGNGNRITVLLSSLRGIGRFKVSAKMDGKLLNPQFLARDIKSANRSAKTLLEAFTSATPQDNQGVLNILVAFAKLRCENKPVSFRSSPAIHSLDINLLTVRE